MEINMLLQLVEFIKSFLNIKKIDSLNDLKKCLEYVYQNKLLFSLKIIVYDKIGYIYYNNSIERNETPNKLIEIEKLFENKFVLIDENFKIIKIHNTIEQQNILLTEDDKSVSYYELYDGLDFIIFYNIDSWFYICQNKIKKLSEYKNMISDNILNNTQYIHYFTCLNKDTYNLITYNQFNESKHGYSINYNMLIYKYSQKNDEINIFVEKNKIENTIQNLYDNFNKHVLDDYQNKKLTFVGYLVKEENKLYEVKSELYLKLNKMKPKLKNTYAQYLKLYQKNNLKEFIQYISEYEFETINRINQSIRILTNEILTIYFMTRRNNNTNKELYYLLPKNYKSVIYDIHGIYVNKCKSDDHKSKSIKIHDIYQYLKSINVNSLIDLFIERKNILDQNKEIFNNIFDINDLNIKILTELLNNN